MQSLTFLLSRRRHVSEGLHWHWREARAQCRECADFASFLSIACGYHRQWLEVDRSDPEELRLLRQVAGARLSKCAAFVFGIVSL